MKLYKFRSLCVDGGLKKTLSIINTGQFWCSTFWNLNDPMEGVYRLQDGAPDYHEVFSEKANCVMCSFSAEVALRNPLMWGYYANGFKGVAVEIEVAPDRVAPMQYRAEVVQPDVTRAVPAQVNQILRCKLRDWSHEAEYRFLERGPEGLYPIGAITAVIIGVPYPRTLVDRDQRLTKLTHLDRFIRQSRRVETAARKRHCRVHTVTMQNGAVELHPDTNIDHWYDE